MKVKVIKSKNRRKTASAKVVNINNNRILEVRVPWWLNKKRTDMVIDNFLKNIQKKKTVKNDEYLQERVKVLNKRYLQLRLPLFSIIWSGRLTSSFGNCYPGVKEIKISKRIADYPSWVVDYVIVHEICHLFVRGHGKKFWNLVNKYPKSERARGFLIAMGCKEAGY
jgi:predicted metal-dependent hydrolase